MAKHLIRDLDNLTKNLLALGDLVEIAIDKATTALVERRVELVDDVIAGDQEIDAREVVIEEECLKILALHQPVAGDLRFIISVLKVNNDLERMGDLAVNIAERAAGLGEEPPFRLPDSFRKAIDRVKEMVRASLTAIVRNDVDEARRVLEADDEVDELHRETFRRMQDLMRAEPDHISRATALISASRNLERIADQATNIAEDILFMVEGEIVRHTHRV